jgi:hypothetical protein
MIGIQTYWIENKAIQLNTGGIITWVLSLSLQQFNQYIAIAGFILSLTTFILARLYQVKENKLKMKNMELDQQIKELEIEKLEKELNDKNNSQ